MEPGVRLCEKFHKAPHKSLGRLTNAGLGKVHRFLARHKHVPPSHAQDSWRLIRNHQENLVKKNCKKDVFRPLGCLGPFDKVPLRSRTLKKKTVSS